MSRNPLVPALLLTTLPLLACEPELAPSERQVHVRPDSPVDIDDPELALATELARAVDAPLVCEFEDEDDSDPAEPVEPSNRVACGTDNDPFSIWCWQMWPGYLDNSLSDEWRCNSHCVAAGYAWGTVSPENWCWCCSGSACDNC